jgi:hypothetical protein
MADIEIMPLGDRLDDEEIAELAGALEKLGAPQLPKASEELATTVTEGLDDDVLSEFLDRLEAHDAACDIYLPIEFDGRVEIGKVRVGSAPALLDLLEEMRDEIFADEDEDDLEEDDDYDEDAEILEVQLRRVWKVLHDAVSMAVERRLPLHIES